MKVYLVPLAFCCLLVACDSGPLTTNQALDKSSEKGLPIFPHDPARSSPRSPLEDPNPPPSRPPSHDPGKDSMPVPEPTTLVLVGSGIAALWLTQRKKKKPF